MDCLASWPIAQTIQTDEFSLDLRHVIADVTASKLVRAAIGVRSPTWSFWPWGRCLTRFRNRCLGGFG
ncbi:MAG: hypothetical protein HC922_08480 [Leptolyngbyaceae cyanobacterium SM2_3_12]|nr:hypothetical protein [Leptolyngbyaceae cyanobacterium SM2_3_12]